MKNKDKIVTVDARFRVDESHQTHLPFFWPWIVPLFFLLIFVLLLCSHDSLLYAGLLMGSVMALTAFSRAAAILAGLFAVRRNGAAAPSPATHLPTSTLPPYTVMVPLYREAEIVDHLLAAMAALRYPRNKLQILLLAEEDDLTTRNALATRQLPESVSVVVVPPDRPRTKPRACNYALDHFVTSDDGFAVIFDAEDRPDPDQLLKAAAAFAALPPNVACLQARLAADQRAKGLSGLLWGVEYAAWFGLYLPGLYAVGAPVPLGGTSNHFRAYHLRRLRWDAWNVTEDAELGIRLARAGLTTGVLNSTTWEDAPAQWRVWLPQRTRWLKGWWVTAATHLTDTRSLPDLGLWRWLWMCHLTLGTVFSHLLLPPALLFGAAWLAGRWPLADPLRLWTWAGPILATSLLLLHLFFIAAHAVATMLQQSRRLLPVVLLLPIAWFMASIAGWRAYLQALASPYYWEKTPHPAPDLNHMEQITTAEPAHSTTTPQTAPALHSPTTPPSSRRSTRHTPRLAAACALTIVMAAVSFGAYYAADIPTLRCAAAALRHEQNRNRFIDLTTASLSPETDWSAASHLEVTFTLSNTTAANYELVTWLKLWDGTWFERSAAFTPTPSDTQTITIPFDTAWRSTEPAARFSPAWLLRVREAGLRLRGPSSHPATLRLLHMRPLINTPPPLAASLISAPTTVAVNDIWELHFDLNHLNGNPFDANEIDLRCVVEKPDATTITLPCFFTLNHLPVANPDGSETMRPYGAPYWAARVSPDLPGTWHVRLEGHDRAATLPPLTTSFTATPSTLPGTVKTAGRWFRRDDSFFYPVTINLRSPYDALVATALKPTPQPPANAGTQALAPWIERCATNGINWIRLWTMPDSLGLEWSAAWQGYHGRNRYNLANASRLDHLFNVARAHHVTLELALWQHGPWQREVDPQWDDNPWNIANGGHLTNPEDLLTDPQLRTAHRNLLRYMAARWGADPALAAWTLWIEVDGATNRGVADWHQEMTTELRRHDSRAPPISTEFRSATDPPATFGLPEIDFTQVAAYDANGLINTFQTRAATFKNYYKPLLLEEYGGHSTGGTPHWLAQQIHDGPWAGLMVDIAATPMPWWWSFIFSQNLDRHLARFAAFIKDEDLSTTEWQFKTETYPTATPQLTTFWRSSTQTAYAWICRQDLTNIPPPKRRHHNWWTYAREISSTYDQNRTSWDPLATTPGPQFPATTLTLNLAHLTPGNWHYQLWDTWTTTPPQAGNITISTNTTITLPPLTRDTAIKFTKLH